MELPRIAQRLRGGTRLAAFAAASAVVACALVRYRSALLGFYFQDDFWVLMLGREALAQFPSLNSWAVLFGEGPLGWTLYRPLTTVGYSAVLQAFFGLDSTAHHAAQLLIFALNGIVVLGVIHRLTDSVLAGAAAGVLYASAPGLAIDAYWLSAFTVTGTATVLLLMCWCWLRTSGCVRVALCAILQVLGLLASEHAVVGPALLAILAVLDARHERLSVVARSLVPGVLLVVPYLLIKGWYVARPNLNLVPYSMTLDPRDWVAQLGQYMAASWNFVALLPLGPRGGQLFGALLVALSCVAAWKARRGHTAWLRVAAGLVFFMVSLGPVIALRTHHYDHYIAVAVVGAILSLLGLLQLATRHWPSLAVALAAAVVLLDAQTGGRAWRDSAIFRLIANGSRRSAVLLQQVQQAHIGAPGAAVWIPYDRTSEYVFTIGRAHTYFPDMPDQVQVYSQPPAPVLESDVVVGLPRFGQLPADPYPGWEQRYDWLRRLARR